MPPTGTCRIEPYISHPGWIRFHPYSSIPFPLKEGVPKKRKNSSNKIMNTSNCFSINKAPHIAFLNNASSSSHNVKPPRFSINNNKQIANQEFQEPKIKQKPIKRQPTILEVEKAIDAGTFRDSDPNRESEKNMKSLDRMLISPFEKNESFAEKQLRETGEWLNQKAERRLRSASRPILVFLVQWMLPIWVVALLIFSGVIKLPFHTPLLDDLLL